MNAERISVFVNGQEQVLDAACSLAELIDQLGHAPETVATAVNAEFVARGLRAERVLQAGDQVSCFQAIVGG